MKKVLTLFIGLTSLSAVLSLKAPHTSWTNDTPVSEVLFTLGAEKPAHYLEPTPEMIKAGRELVTEGRTVLPSGAKSAYISKYYTCTSCHNTVREDPDLTLVDPDARLDFAIANQIPYLQASTFWGIVNRETWYNGDYEKKYGQLVEPARNSLKESVQLCATVCAQGREVNDWEMKQILAYFWSLEMKLGDLNLSEKTSSLIESEQLSASEKINLIKESYLVLSPATFGEVPQDKEAGYPYKGDRRLGKAIYQLGCQHCHRPEGESDVVFDNTSLTYNWLKKHIPANTQQSLYEIIRKGTYAEYGHQEYMPHYTLEKMSDQQVEHLRAFIENPF
ncbi:c-type cytochrome [Marinoscillum furvescens]|uniref:Cbb3-type cytochrome c oxidase subunit III n=1 Tax=Marinoscillum furvescens DSM 4134 TaxID=1122208 RepID=A0A3D9LFY8_MARFU|nr:cytochrome c [Marinoscillum furvescens]REE05580.1 cbb3-type cytochrome c oxidase subunit III [Marinoscillum furvescens DSM 4134]